MDGDQPFKQGHLKEGYETLSSDMTKAFGKYWMKEKDAPKEIWQPYTDELVRLTLEMATVASSEKQQSSNNNNNDSGGNNKNNVVLSFAMIRREMRDYTKMKLRKAGAVDVTFLFLHCTMDVLLESKWKRTLHFIEAGDLSMEEGAIFTPGLKGEFNYTNFCKFEREFGTSGHCEPPSISDEPYIEIDVSARDRTVLNEIDKTLGLVGKRKRIITMDDVNNVVVAENNDIDYYHNEIEYEVKCINHARDKEWLVNVDLEKLKENLKNFTTETNSNSNSNSNSNDDDDDDDDEEEEEEEIENENNFGYVDGDQPMKQGHLKKRYKALGNDMIKALGKYFHPFS